MITIFIFALVFFMFTLIAQWLLHKVRKNHNRGASAMWVGTSVIIGMYVLGIITKNINYFAAILGFVLGDEVGKQAGWQ